MAAFAIVMMVCLVLIHGGQCKGLFNAAEALHKAKDAENGDVGPDVKAFNVLDYAAKPDGRTDSSIVWLSLYIHTYKIMGFFFLFFCIESLLDFLQNFRRAFEAACNFHGDAMMVIPEGEFLMGPVLFSGPCSNPSLLIIQVNGIVKAQSNMAYYRGGGDDDTDWITFQAIDGLIVSGRGTFHGQGSQVWGFNDCARKSNCVRLPAVSFESPLKKHFGVFFLGRASIKFVDLSIEAFLQDKT